MDRRKFKAVAFSHIDSVHRVAMQLDRRPGAVEDLVEATYERTLKDADGSGRLGNDVRLRLLRTLHDHASEKFGSAMHESRMAGELGEEVAEETRCAEDAQHAELRVTEWERPDGRLERAIERLSPSCRMVLVLWGAEGLTPSELAFVLDCPIGTISARLSQARDQLTEQLVGIRLSPGPVTGRLRNVG